MFRLIFLGILGYHFMSKTLRSVIGLLLLITTVTLATCQSLYNATPFGNDETSLYDRQ